MTYTFFYSFNFINNPLPGKNSAAFGPKKKKFFLSLLLLIGQAYAHAQSCDCPPVAQCGTCQGGITSLTLRYDGLLGLGATITANDDSPGVLFSGWVDSGSTFTITGSNPDATFNGDEVHLTALLINTTINTSCGTAVYVNSTYGNFTVVAGESKDGGPICCAPTDLETTPPVISNCPADIQIAVVPSECSTVVSWTAPTASDNCGSAILTSTHNPGDTFVKGSTSVVYIATDDYGNTSTCSFNVLVDDDTGPVIAGCPSADIIVNADASCEAIANWTAPTASDNCGPVALVSPINPGDVFPLGTTIVTYTATDESGNISTCTFNVIVNDNTDPVITGCPSDILVSANGSCEAVVNWTAPTISDNCGSVALTTNHNPGETFPLGTTAVVYTATDDDGNISTCSFNVVVSDDTDPVIAGCITADIVVPVTVACQGIASWIRPTATDNCGAPTLTSSHNPGNSFDVGTTQVTYTATDNSGNISICSFNVIVQDVTSPMVSGCIPSDIIVSANEMCQATATWAPPTAADNCGSATMTSSHAPGSLFLLGSTTITYTATDGSGNTSTCTFKVIVKDETDPVLSGCPATDIVVDANSSCQAFVSWTPPTATDDCGTAILTSTHGPGTSFDIGTTLVTYTAEDDAGNTSTCSFNVTVIDNTAPAISACPTSDIIVNGTSCQSIVNWTAPSVSDNCGTVVLTSSHNSGEVFPVGSTTVTYTASDDSGNTSTCTFNVIVTDTTDPTISGCVSSDIMAIADGSCKAAVNWIAPLVSDDCDAVTLVSSHEPGDLFDLGTTVVTYTATDSHGNTATCAFNVIVKDETSPVLSGCSDVITRASASCETSVTWTPPKVSDCQSTTLISSHSPGDLFSPGTTEVTYTATDTNGNTSSCKFNVIVEDKTSPVFQNCPEEIVTSVENGCDAIVSWVEPTASDNCGAVTMTKSHAPGDTFSTGTTNVKYTATDIYGNVSVCTFNVTVSIEMPPFITNCPVDINVNGNEYGEASVDWTPPTGTSACSEVVLTTTHPPGAVFSVGTTVVEYKVEDSFGNVSYCRFKVVVAQQEIDIDISKVVTPDGNGVNDEWIVSNIEKFNDNKVVIVDRWGSVIYTASGYNNANVVWKGVNRNGGTVPTGTYFYTISVRYGDSAFEKSGFIELIR